MANENETVMAVCAEWRDCIVSADPSVWNDERIAGLVKTTKAQQLAYLARIEAAWRREKSEIEANALSVGGIVEAARHKLGNAAAMREACQKMRDLLMLRGDGKAYCILSWDEFNDSQKMLRSAISAPARQCDVGTAEEQIGRFREFCQAEKCGRYRCRGGSKSICIDRCAIAWAQMPYAAEEGAGE